MGDRETLSTALSRPPCQPSTASPENIRYRRSLEALAALAPSLKEAELRVLLHLVARAIADNSSSVAASSRDLEVATKTARRGIQRAIDGLATRGLVAVRQGTPRSPATYLLRFLEVAQMPEISGVFRTPHPAAQGEFFPQPAASLEHLRGVEGTPPPTANQRVAPRAAAVDPEGFITLEGILDRLSRAKPRDFDPEVLATARRFMAGYRAKLGNPRNWDGPHPPHPPDDRITAQFLSMGDGCGGWPRLESLLYDLLAERQEPGHKYAWFVTVAAQRIHGIDPRLLKQRRDQLRLVRAQGKQELEQIGATLASIANTRRMLP